MEVILSLHCISGFDFDVNFKLVEMKVRRHQVKHHMPLNAFLLARRDTVLKLIDRRYTH